MVRLATMNLTLRGLANVRILRRNVLTTSLDPARQAELGLPLNGYNVILANPPFSGRLDADRIIDEVRIGSTTATEILFLKYMMDNLVPGGRCGVVIPEGVLFGSTGAHKELRRQLLENHAVEAVLSLPGGVFQPYSGVKTSVLFFRKPEPHEPPGTQRVLFLHADNDGYKLDANHDTPIAADDLPGLVQAYREREASWQRWQRWQQYNSPLPEGEGPGVREEWTENWWFADLETLRANDLNLSAGRYRPLSRNQIEHRPVAELVDELKAIELEILNEVDALAEKLAAERTSGPAEANPAP